MGLYNVYYYLLKAAKYKVFANTFIYAIAFTTIITSISYAALITEEDKCNLTAQFSFYIRSYCKFLLGIVQASVLTTLYLQLRSLFKISG